MDTLSMFEQKLKGSDLSLDQAEANWDQRADTFYYNQVNGSRYFASAVPHLLEEKGILNASSRILDIGSGSGRYAIPLAEISESVLALDVSSEMLQFLRQEMEKNALRNIDTIQSAWPPAKSIGEFDVAFSAMCPATRSVEALKEMSNVANKYGVLCQFTASTDTIIEALIAHQLIEKETTGPHNDRELLQAYFTILWELGYNPEITYLYDDFKMNMSLDKAFDTYQKRYEHVNSEQLKNILAEMQQQNGEDIEVVKKRTLAVVSWET